MAEHNTNNGSTPLLFDEEMCERYLLGELSDAEQEKFETSYFSDDVFFDRFMAVKNELLDLYSRGELDPAKQEKVRAHFSATAPRSRQIAVSKQFIDAVTGLAGRSDYEVPAPEQLAEPQPFFSFLKFSSLVWATAAVLLFTGFGLWWLSTRTLEDVEVTMVQQSPEADISAQSSIDELDSRISKPTDLPDVTIRKFEKPVDRPNNVEIKKTDIPGKKAKSLKGSAPESPKELRRIVKGIYEIPSLDDDTDDSQARLVLNEVATRDLKESNELELYSDTKTVSIVVPVGKSANEYTATITTVDGEFRWKTKKPQTAADGKLTFVVKAKVLTPSGYILTVSGSSYRNGISLIIAEHYFVVVAHNRKKPSLRRPSD